MVATCIWIAGWAWHYYAICRDFDRVVFQSGFFYCSSHVDIPPGFTPPPDSKYDFSNVEKVSEEIGAIELVATLVSIPLGTLAMGRLTTWVIRGFRSRVE
jgi:hypothetical protein